MEMYQFFDWRRDKRPDADAVPFEQRCDYVLEGIAETSHDPDRIAVYRILLQAAVHTGLEVSVHKPLYVRIGVMRQDERTETTKIG